MRSNLKAVHTAVFVLLFTAGAIYAIFHFTWIGLAIGFLYWFIANCPGTGMCFHRLLTHRGYEVPKWLEYTLTICGCLALQGSPIQWVAVHRAHHKYAEQPGLDPHTPREGIYWAQWLWMVLKNPSVDQATNEKYAKDLLKDPIHVLIGRLWWVPSTIIGIVLIIISWPDPALVLWGLIVPVAIGWEITWLVNSVTHKWGSRRFATDDDSTNNWSVALLTFGEGWHNNHHHNPTSARHGLAWYEIDINYYSIRLLGWLGLAKKIKLGNESH